MKKLIITLLIVVAILCIAAWLFNGGGQVKIPSIGNIDVPDIGETTKPKDVSEPTPDPNLGTYDAVYAEIHGKPYMVSDIYPDGLSVQLMKNGEGVFNYGGKSYRINWTLDGDAFHAAIKINGMKVDGTLSYGILHVEDLGGKGIALTLIDQTRVDMDVLYNGTYPPEEDAENPDEVG